MSIIRAGIIGLTDTQLSLNEAKLIAQYNPAGVILFARNIKNPTQLKGLIADIRQAGHQDISIWVDQEGGRVQRLRAPHWPEFPSMRSFGRTYEDCPQQGEGLLRTATILLAQELRNVGISVDCHPVVDLLWPETHDVIGDRAFASDPKVVVSCAQIVIKTLQESGIIPVVKHFPGHGRAQADSHFDLPYIDVPFDQLVDEDFYPFKALINAPIFMTAHIVFTAIDSLPATFSRLILHNYLRQELNFQGLVVSDDLDMKALAHFGNVQACAEQTFAAGADLALFCPGDFAGNQHFLSACPILEGHAAQCWWALCSQPSLTPLQPSDQALNDFRHWADKLNISSHG